jgi:ABC-type ATPase with predicted acetyltransferase domain
MRTISRVIVHPVFRSAGLAVRLVRHVLEHAETPYVEALAVMGRVHPFFKRAGMVEFDRPPLAGHVRMVAALEREGLLPMDLVDCGRVVVSDFLRGELRRFVGKEMSDLELVRVARGRILSQPLYYLWRNSNDEIRMTNQ